MWRVRERDPGVGTAPRSTRAAATLAGARLAVSEAVCRRGAIPKCLEITARGQTMRIRGSYERSRRRPANGGPSRLAKPARTWSIWPPRRCNSRSAVRRFRTCWVRRGSLSRIGGRACSRRTVTDSPRHRGVCGHPRDSRARQPSGSGTPRMAFYRQFFLDRPPSSGAGRGLSSIQPDGRVDLPAGAVSRRRATPDADARRPPRCPKALARSIEHGGDGKWARGARIHAMAVSSRPSNLHCRVLYCCHTLCRRRMA